MATAETVDIDYLTKVELREGDTLVLRLAHMPSADAARRLVEQLKLEFPNNKVLILHPGADLEVVTTTDLKEAI